METQELWGELETEEHHRDSALVWSVLNGLLDVLRVKRYVLEFDQFHKADVEVQDILRNVGFFNTIMKVINLLERVEEEEVVGGMPGMTGNPGSPMSSSGLGSRSLDGEDVTVAGGSTMLTSDGRTVFLNEGSLNCLNQVKAANTLLCWFLYRNPANQELGYEELEFFMDSLDRGVNSHMVIKCVFEGNEKVCKQCPFETMELMANLICKEGQKHYY